jgi:NADPH:quinone reductase-like Zn-dependent oxidoreductase
VTKAMDATMPAVEFDHFGGTEVLMARQVPRPIAAAGEVLVSVVASSVNPKDTFIRKGRFKALTGEVFPMRTGFDFAGVVLAAGDESADFKPGDRVWGMINGWHGGASAGVLAISADIIAPAPAELTLTEAAAIPLAALTALQALRDVGGLAMDADLPQRRVLVTAAAGGVGLFAVQIASAAGAHVIAMASPGNEALCRAHGAAAFLPRGSPLPGDGDVDVLFDAFGALAFTDAWPALAADGVFVATVPSPDIFSAQGATQGETGKRARLVVVRGNRQDLDLLAALVAAGRLRPHLDAIYPLDAIADAHAHVERKRTRGKVVVMVGNET